MTVLQKASAPDFMANLSTLDGGVPMLQFEGRAEVAAKEVLGAFLRAVDGELVQRSASTVTVDFRKLTFMNSSCFKDFVVWLSEVRKRPLANRYKLRFVSNPGVRWQRASLSTLSTFAVDLVEIVSE